MNGLMCIISGERVSDGEQILEVVVLGMIGQEEPSAEGVYGYFRANAAVD
jgi:hypothetical protein